MPPLSYEARTALFWSKVIKTRSCWLWTGVMTKYGHGSFDWPGVAYTAHRIAWILTNGPLLPGFIVCHKKPCVNRHCVRPSHMTIGIQADNNRDSNRRLRGTGLVGNYRKPRVPFEERFWGRVSRGDTEDCWLWHGFRDKDGYGRITMDGAPRPASRVAWILTHGSIADDMLVCHDCPGGDNPACVNPQHLWLGTHADNIADCIKKGRRITTPYVFTDEQCHLLHALYQSGQRQYELAQRFQVSQSSIWRAIQRAILLKHQYPFP
jgi:hypothetical protein